MDNETARPSSNDHARVVALAGAPGLEAITRVVRNLPPDSGLAIIVASGGIELAHELRAVTTMPVLLVEDGTPVSVDQVHVIPSGHCATLTNGTLRLTPDAASNGAVDRLLRSMAEERGRDAIAVVLSGNGSDGLLGIKRIKETGGFILSQSLDDAETSDLPRSAIATGLTDVVGSADEIAARLIALGAARVDLVDTDDERRSPDAMADALRDILTVVRIRSGHDFSNYKRATLYRRISRRMQVAQSETIRDYQRFLRDHPSELAHLLRDFLISVTSFFRDPEAFDALSHQVLAHIFPAKDTNEPMRVWVAGCATGEEAYSLGMLLAEHAERHNAPQLQIFATDIDEDALAEARTGRYPDTIAVDVSQARLARFFEREGTHYRVRKELRELILFSPHNVLRDPPFSRLDLVSCRNLLIYLNRDAQDRVLNMFHFGLRTDGYLFLGSSESAETTAMQFTPVDAKHRIFGRRTISTPLGFDTFAVTSRWASPVAPAGPSQDRPTSFGELHHQLVEQYAPPSALVNDDLEIVHLSESAGRYLTIGGGEPTRHLMKLVMPALRLDLRSALYAARQSPRGAESRMVRFDEDGVHRSLELTVRVFDTTDIGQRMTLVLFAERDPEAEERMAAAMPADRAIEPVVRELEDELHRTRDQLRTTIEQYETSLEELKASNEELHAINEELRSATEELETSKEELQSVNEELTTLNHELKVKIDEVSRANSDLQNLMTSTDIGVLFLDRNLNIKRFTPRAQELINVIPSDVGRPLAHLTHRLQSDDLPDLAGQVLQHLRLVECEIRARDGRRYLARLLPYRTVDDRIEGVVLTFINVSELKQAEDARRNAEAALRASEARFRFAMRSAPLIVLSQDPDLRYTWGHLLGAPVDFVGKTDGEAFPGPVAARMTSIKREVVTSGVGQRAELELTAGGQPRVFDFHFEPIAGDLGEAGVMSVGFDITPSKAAEQVLRDADRRKDEFLATLSHELRNPLTPLRAALDLQKVAGDDLARIEKAREMMERQVDQLTQLVDDLLDLSRITQDKITLNQRQVSLRDVIAAAIEGTQQMIDQQGHHLTINHGDDGVVRGDFTRLTQIFVNLLSNAAKYTPPRGQISIDVVPDPGRRTFVIRVRDNGVGIAPELLPRLFEIFVQSREQLARSRNGLGIGLNLVRRLVKLHGGTVRAESDGIGHGSVFIVELPVMAPEEVDAS